MNVESLQRRRSQLVKQFNAHRASAQRQLIGFVAAHNKAAAIDVKIALLDRQLNGLIDQSLQRVFDHTVEIGPIVERDNGHQDEN